MTKIGKALASLTAAGALTSGLFLAAAPASAAVRAGTWSCTGIPDSYVSLEIDPDHCDGSRGDLVSPPAPGQWICGWSGDALTGYVFQFTQPNSARCAGGTAYYIILSV